MKKLTRKELLEELEKHKNKNGKYDCICNHCGKTIKDCETPNVSICYECSH